MKWKIASITTILVLIIIVILFFQIKLPMCYNTFEEDPTETYVIYEREIVTQVKQQIEQFPLHYVRISGHSMQPGIKHGDVCVCVKEADYNKGDIISFYIPVNEKVELISHRISFEENNKFLTKGDANINRDAWWLTNEQIFCKIPEKTLFDKLRFAVVESEGRFSIFSIFG